MEDKKVIAVDFDGVIHDFKNPIPHRRMGGPVAGAKEAMERLASMGYHIVIFTVWGGTEAGRKTIADWCNYYEVPFDDITNIKPNASYYIDDKAIRFESWDQALSEIN